MCVCHAPCHTSQYPRGECLKSLLQPIPTNTASTAICWGPRSCWGMNWLAQGEEHKLPPFCPGMCNPVGLPVFTGASNRLGAPSKVTSVLDWLSTRFSTRESTLCPQSFSFSSSEALSFCLKEECSPPLSKWFKSLVLLVVLFPVLPFSCKCSSVIGIHAAASVQPE